MMIRRWSFLIRWIAVVLCICFGPGQVMAQTPALTITASHQYEFADHLFQDGQYRRAAEEYQRFVFFFPKDTKRREAEFQTAEAYRLAGDLATALKRYQHLTRTFGSQPDSIVFDSFFMMAECYLQMQAINQAVLQLHNVIALSPDVLIRDKAYYRRGWISADNGDWGGARRAWNMISGQSHLPKDKLIAALENTSQIPYKSPTMAGTLSVIPGMGQLYLGRGQDALVALVVTGGSFLASYEAFDNDLPALGAMLALVGAGFYAGNIYGAISGAHKYNRQKISQFSNQLKQQTDRNRPHSLRNGETDAHLQMLVRIHF